MGGGGFSMEPEVPLLDDHVLGLARASRGRDRPRVCFLATASGDSPAYIASFYAAFARRAEATHLPLFMRAVDDIEAFLLDQDVVYVGGGNTENMMAIWRVHGVDRALRRAWEAGIVLTGLSAGSLCWFETGTTDSFGAVLTPLSSGLGLIPGSHSPHYDGEASRRPHYHWLVADGVLPAGYAADDGAALVFRGTELAEVVTSRPRRTRLPRGTWPGRRCGGDGAADALPRLNRAPPPASGVPLPDRPHRVGVVAGCLAAPGGLDRGPPARRHEPRSQVGEGREDEQANGGGRMRHLEELRGLRRVRLGVERPGSRGPLHRDPRPTEHDEIQVELARAPAPPDAASEGALEVLEARQQGQRARCRVRTGRHVECHGGVAELGLVDDPHRFGRVEAGDASQAYAGELVERPNRLDQLRLGLADVGAQADVRADSPVAHGCLMHRR
jgi:dipeptidase E